MNKEIIVEIKYNKSNITISSEKGDIQLYTNSSLLNKNRQDFAAWLFLPIAMRLGKNLYIKGMGVVDTINNAEQLSRIWATWIPNHFKDIKVKFSDVLTIQENTPSLSNNKLCFYSGGVDSTHTIIKHLNDNNLSTLLTVHGMDYSLNDNSKFNDFIKKTDDFANYYSKERIFIKSNAYEIYNKYKINTKKSHISHIFALAGCGFLFSEFFDEIIIAADYRIDQQFLVSPWGSNSATNHLFNDGITKLITKDDNISRTDKISLIGSNKKALQALTFCIDKKSRPYNCGICGKCIRTKLMFLASIGEIPDIFKIIEIPKKAFQNLNIKKASEQAFIMDLYFCAKKNNRLILIPELELIKNKIIKYRKSYSL